MSACIGEPVSWLRLEQHALAHDATVATHLDACIACREAFAAIGPIELPRLVFAAAPARKRRWWLAAAPAALAFAAILLIVLRKPADPPENIVAIKGGGDLVLGVVRERAGAIAFDARGYRAGDRWKIVVTCPPAVSTWLDVVVFDQGEASYPISPAHVACGNQIVVPGAFSITGSNPNRVCVRVSTEAKGPGDLACVTLRPE